MNEWMWKVYAFVIFHCTKFKGGFSLILSQRKDLPTLIEITTWGLFTRRWGTQVGEVTRVSIYSLILIWSCLRDRWSDPPNVTSPNWGPPPSCRQALKETTGFSFPLSRHSPFYKREGIELEPNGSLSERITGHALVSYWPNQFISNLFPCP